jgi:hypothetical protein
MHRVKGVGREHPTHTGGTGSDGGGGGTVETPGPSAALGMTELGWMTELGVRPVVVGGVSFRSLPQHCHLERS